MRLIDADALGARMYYEVFGKDSADQRWDSGCWIRYRLFEKVLKETPTVESEQKTGKWVRAYDCDCFQCNQCGTPSIVARPYCCICGAKMEVNHDNLY